MHSHNHPFIHPTNHPSSYSSIHSQTIWTTFNPFTHRSKHISIHPFAHQPNHPFTHSSSFLSPINTITRPHNQPFIQSPISTITVHQITHQYKQSTKSPNHPNTQHPSNIHIFHHPYAQSPILPITNQSSQTFVQLPIISSTQSHIHSVTHQTNHTFIQLTIQTTLQTITHPFY